MNSIQIAIKWSLLQKLKQKLILKKKVKKKNWDFVLLYIVLDHIKCDLSLLFTQLDNCDAHFESLVHYLCCMCTSMVSWLKVENEHFVYLWLIIIVTNNYSLALP